MMPIFQIVGSPPQGFTVSGATWYIQNTDCNSAWSFGVSSWPTYSVLATIPGNWAIKAYVTYADNMGHRGGQWTTVDNWSIDTPDGLSYPGPVTMPLGSQANLEFGILSQGKTINQLPVCIVRENLRADTWLGVKQNDSSNIGGAPLLYATSNGQQSVIFDVKGRTVNPNPNQTYIGTWNGLIPGQVAGTVTQTLFLMIYNDWCNTWVRCNLGSFTVTTTKAGPNSVTISINGPVPQPK